MEITQKYMNEKEQEWDGKVRRTINSRACRKCGDTVVDKVSYFCDKCNIPVKDKRD